MRRPALMRTCLLAAGLGMAGAAFAAKPTGFYVRGAEGWFWYERMPVPLKPEQPEPAQPVSSVPGRAAPAPPALFSAAWFRRNLPKYKDLAWDHPTLTNLRAFLLVQRLSIDRSERFAEVAELATLGDPALDEIARRPTATFAAQAVDRQSGKRQTALLTSLAQKAGLLFFFRSDCVLCSAQAPLIRALARNHGFAVLPVSLDGKALPGHPFPGFRRDEGQAARLGVRTLPALYLTARDGRFSAVGQGAMALPELEHRLLAAALREGWITAAEFDRSRPVQSLRFDETLGGLQAADETSGFIPPARLAAAFQAHNRDVLP